MVFKALFGKRPDPFKTLYIQPADDVAGSGGMPSQISMSHLLNCDLPRLRSLAFEGDPDEPITQHLPDSFLDGRTCPELVSLMFSHISEQQAARFSALQARVAEGYEQNGHQA